VRQPKLTHQKRKLRLSPNKLNVTMDVAIPKPVEFAFFQIRDLGTTNQAYFPKENTPIVILLSLFGISSLP